MPYALAPGRPLYWAVTLGANALETGQSPLGSMTCTGEDKALISDVSENAFLGKVAGKAGAYKPLPIAGTPLQAGEIYGYSGGLVMVRQSHNRTEHAPADVPSLFTVYRADAGDTLDWVAGERVEVGTRRTHGGKTWEALQAHQAEFAPDLTPALWREVVSGIAAWKQPTGAHDAYAFGAIVTHNSQTWRSLYAANVWEPGVFGWQVV